MPTYWIKQIYKNPSVMIRSFILSCISIYPAHADSNDLFGKWKCDKISGSNELFSFTSTTTSEYKTNDIFHMYVDYSYDFKDKGTADITFQIDGSWQLENETMKLTRDKAEITHLNLKLTSDGKKSEDDLKSFLEKNHPFDKFWSRKIVKISSDSATYLNQKGDEFKCNKIKTEK